MRCGRTIDVDVRGDTADYRQSPPQHIDSQHMDGFFHPNDKLSPPKRYQCACSFTLVVCRPVGPLYQRLYQGATAAFDFSARISAMPCGRRRRSAGTLKRCRPPLLDTLMDMAAWPQGSRPTRPQHYAACEEPASSYKPAEFFRDRRWGCVEERPLQRCNSPPPPE